ncbi:MAG: UDP-N-acetylmuramoyl-tripeptide--D-alanyl-D-alanine ligase [Bacteroidetes bacterium]|nr:UDP-N-acetylmuramoyl-tripeptide--D-alanyl-D-alanine ligase [Bacteroidota bacterium]
MPVYTSAEQLWAVYQSHPRVCTDTRQLQPGDLFFALKGPHFDGNRYAQSALDAGAAAAVVDDAHQESLPGRLLVPDVLAALQQLAHTARRRAGLPVLAITGSNGKTTTKELIAQVLQGWQPALVTPGNFNNHIGLPLTLLQLQPQHRVIVLEMGDNHPGEIATLCRIAEPTAGLITNVGLDHLEGYGSLEANIATKLELFDYLDNHGGDLLVNTGEAPLEAYGAQHPGYSYGPGGRFRSVKAAPRPQGGMAVWVKDTQSGETLPLETHLMGQHNVENLLACVAACTWLGVPAEQITHGIAHYIPRNNRSQLLSWTHGHLLLDAYNANPSSMEAAIRTAFEWAQGPLLLVLGDMLELGDFSREAHRQLAELVQSLGKTHRHPWFVILVGEEIQATARELPPTLGIHFHRTTEAMDMFTALAPRYPYILLKGSRGIALEQLLAAIGVSMPPKA